jgi:hypothetical protein
MEANYLHDGSEKLTSSAQPVLEVLILYEDFGTGLRAKCSLDLLLSQCRMETGFRTKIWKVDLLSEPLLREQAAIEAAGSDVILLSVHGRGNLPVAMLDWLSRLLHYKEDRPYAIGLMLDPEAETPAAHNAIRTHLQQVAAAAGVDFFCDFRAAPVPMLESFRERIQQRAYHSSNVLDQILRTTPRPTGDLREF